MGIGRQVADAYISVHGDLSQFREDLNDANTSMEAWAKENATAFSDAWGERMQSTMSQQWNSVVDALYSGKKIDFDRMIDNFDDSDMDNAVAKIEDMLYTMEKLGKLEKDQYEDAITNISREVEARKEAFQEQKLQEEQLAEIRRKAADALKVHQQQQFGWQDAHLKMMDQMRERQQRDLDHVTALRENAIRTHKAQEFGWQDAQIKMMDALKERRQRNADHAKALIENQDRLQKKLAAEAKKAMADMIADNRRWSRSFAGMAETIKTANLERDFRMMADALASNDWSAVARGSKNMEEVRIKVMQTAEAMRDLGRMTDTEFARVRTTLGDVAKDMDLYNVTFDQANKNSEKHKRDWTIIEAMISSAGKKFAGFTGLNVLTDMFRTGADFFQNLDRNAVKIGKMALQIGGAVSIITAAVGGIAVIGQDLAKMGQIGILAPGFLTGAAIQIGVLAAAFKDIGTELADLGPKFGILQTAISSRFWEMAEEPIRNLANKLLPGLATSIEETATQLGGVFAALAGAIDTVPLEMMNTMFERMNSAIEISAGAMQPLVHAFVSLGDAGSQYFERFATGLVEISTQFNNFIQAAAADGRLNLWIEEAIQAFKDVGTVIAATVGIFNAIGDAAEAAGIGGLTEFAASMAGASATMNSAGFQTGLTLLFAGAADAARSIGAAIRDLGPELSLLMPVFSAALGTIGDTIATVIGYIGQIFSHPSVLTGITVFTTLLQTGVEALAPAMDPLAQGLGTVMTLLGQVAALVGEVASAFLIHLSPVLDTVGQAFGRIAFAAGPEIVEIIGILAPLMQTMVDTILPPLENLIMTVLPLLAPAFAAVVPIIEALIPIWELVITAISDLVAMIAPFLIPAIQQISAAVAPVIAIFGELIGFILSGLVPILGFLLIGIINNVVGVFQGMSNFIQGAVAILTAIFTGFGAFFTKLFQGDIGGALTALGTMFGQIWDGIVQMLSGALEFIWNLVQLLFIGKLIGGIKSGLTAIVNFFKSSWDNVGSTVSGALSNIVGFINAGLARAAQWVTNGLNNMVSFFRSGFSNMSSATSAGIANVMSFIGSIPGRISGALSGLGSLLVGAGRAIIDGLLRGLKAAWGAVTSFVGGIASWIAENKGPLPYDRRLLEPAGNAIMYGLNKGLMDKLTTLKSTLETVTDTMTDTVTSAFAKNRMYLAGADAALGLADGLKSNKNAVAGALAAVMPSSEMGLNVSAATAPGRATATENTPVVGGTVIADGAIRIVTPTKSPELVAAKVIDEFAAYSNL